MTSPFYHQPSHSLTLIFCLVSNQTLFPPFHVMPPHLWTFLLLPPALTSVQGPPILHHSSTAPQLTSQLSYSHPVILHIHLHYVLRQYKVPLSASCYMLSLKPSLQRSQSTTSLTTHTAAYRSSLLSWLPIQIPKLQFKAHQLYCFVVARKLHWFLEIGTSTLHF